MLEAIVTFLGAALLGVFGWAFQISNKISVIEAEYEGLRELINEKFKGVNDRLDRIEDKL